MDKAGTVWSLNELYESGCRREVRDGCVDYGYATICIGYCGPVRGSGMSEQTLGTDA